MIEVVARNGRKGGMTTRTGHVNWMRAEWGGGRGNWMGDEKGGGLTMAWRTAQWNGGEWRFVLKHATLRLCAKNHVIARVQAYCLPRLAGATANRLRTV